MIRTVLTLTLALWAQAGIANAPVVTAAKATPTGETHTITVTLRHADTGWDHYADGWSVRLLDGTELGYRTLPHPHVDEQPFTRSLSGVVLPAGTTEIMIVPHDSVHGWGAPFPIEVGN